MGRLIEWLPPHPHILRKTRRKKAKNISYYKQEKLAANVTIDGKGIVARLMRRAHDKAG